MPNSSPTTSADLPLLSQFWTASSLKVLSNFRCTRTEVCFSISIVQCSPNSLSVNSRQPHHQHIDTNGNPYLGLHRVVAGPVKVFDPQVLLDPFEEQLHLPTALVEQCDGRGRERKIVCQKDQALVRLRIDVMDAAQFVRVMFDARRVAQPDDLITAHSGGGIDRA